MISARGPGVSVVCAAVCAVVCALLSACSGSSGSQAEPPASAITAQKAIGQLLGQASEDAISSGSVHVSSVFRRGTQSQTYRGDVALDRGRQLIHFKAIRAEVIVIGRRAFIGGNSAAMADYFGLPSQAHLAGKWASLTPADRDFTTVAADVTLKSYVTDLLPTGPWTRVDSMSDGQPIIGITGSPPAAAKAPAGAHETIYLSTGSDPLPIRETDSAPDGTSGTITLSHWGEPVKVSAPARAIPIATIVPGL